MSKDNKDLENLSDIDGMEEDDTIVFTDDSGKEVEFSEIAYFEYQDKFYSALVPVEEVDSDEPTVYFCSVTEDGDGYEELEMVEDEALVNQLFDEFEKLQEEEGCGDDCGCGCKDGKKCDCDK